MRPGAGGLPRRGRQVSAEQRAPVAPTMLAAALDAAAAGWAVLPCAPGGARAKAPLTGHGHHDASRDPAVIAAWWTGHPAAMIGAAVPATLLVLDIDPRNGGSLPALVEALGELPATLTAWSGRGDGGRHLYFARPPGAVVSTRLPPGVDLKVAGYCIVPPSRHPATGQPYWWEHAPVAVLPPAALAALRPPARPVLARRLGPTPVGAGRGLVAAVAGAGEGQRNSVLYWACRRALEEEHDASLLEELGDAAVAAGLPPTQVRATIDSARRGAGVTC